MILGLFDGANYVNYSFTLTVLKPMDPPQIKTNLGPPQYIERLQQQYVVVGYSITYDLPSIEDPDQDEWKVEISLGALKPISSISNDNSSIKVFPTVEQSVGAYSIKIVLTDKNSNPLSTSYNLTINVISNLSAPAKVYRNSTKVPNQAVKIVLGLRILQVKTDGQL